MVGSDLKNPKVGFVVPTLGLRDDYLRSCLESLKQQGELPYVVVVRPADNRGIDPQVSSLVNAFVDDPGLGLSGAINVGMSVMPNSVEYVSWLGDDDLLEFGALEHQVRILERDSSLLMVFGKCRYIDAEGKAFLTFEPSRLYKFLTSFGPNQVAQPASIFRKAIFYELGGLDNSLKYAMDLDLWLRLFRFGHVEYTPHVLASYRWHAQSLSAASEKRARSESSRVRRRYLSPWLWPLEYLIAAAAEVSTLLRGSSLNRKS